LIITSFGWSAEDFQVDHLFLPIGISFYTFQSISYLVDVKRNKIAIPRFQDYLLYMTFFPHLVAGPIVRAKDFLPQLKRKLRITSAHVSEGFYLITKGLIKKAIIADFVGQYVDIIFASPSGSSGLESLVATLCYTLQIFCDFSGYTDMAIGIALLMGYQLCLNFDSPYQSTSITEFWRRWHISLSTWLRDFIYIPIGGNRKGFALQLLFLLITMSVGGIWHGADWKFLWWGVGHGVILICHKLVIKLLPESTNRWWRLSGWFFTFSAVAILWIPFRALSTSDSIIIIEKIFTSIRWEECWELFRQNTLLISLLIAGFAATLLNQVLKVKLKTWYIREPLMIKMIILLIVIQIMFQMQSATVQPFIYFQF
jgi:D-alanyl-lipoteichoic acid acyltransferase DltB (MBOAT superfamily)